MLERDREQHVESQPTMYQQPKNCGCVVFGGQTRRGGVFDSGTEGGEKALNLDNYTDCPNFVIIKKLYNMQVNTTARPLSNLQLELVKLYADNVSDDDLLAIQRLIAQYFAEKASDLADKAWDERNLDASKLLNTSLKSTF
jgi:hypothetical protein